jgi:hypothetical protein
MKVVLCLLLALLGIANGHGYGGGHGGWVIVFNVHLAGFRNY